MFPLVKPLKQINHVGRTRNYQTAGPILNIGGTMMMMMMMIRSMMSYKSLKNYH
jgi:hypothetical protein